jgi:hypothetical protein
MSGDPDKVHVVISPPPQAFQAHHGDIPELQSDGESPLAAATNLAQDLAREIDGTADTLHREPAKQALTDVEAYIEHEK